jgi:lactoylglutathione lyase
MRPLHADVGKAFFGQRPDVALVEIYSRGQEAFGDQKQTEQTMRFGYAIIYVPNVPASIEFFERAFGLKRRFLHESGYGELETGETALAFATHAIGKSNLPDGYVEASASKLPLGMEIALITESVHEAHAKAVAAGAVSVKEPIYKPWGQTVSYVRCPDGTLVELCSPMPA